MFISTYSEDNIINSIFRGSSFTSPTTISFAAVTAAPGVGDTGSTIAEVSTAGGTSYARATLNPSTSNYTAPSSGSTSNAAAITFPVAGASWGTVVGVCMMGSSTVGAGNVLIYFPFSVSKSPGAGDTLQIATSELTYTIS